RPGVDLRVGEPGESVDHARARHRDAGARPTGEVAHRAGRVARGLLVAEAEVVDPFLLDRRGDAVDGVADDAERVLDALRLERLGDDGAAADLGWRFDGVALRPRRGGWGDAGGGFGAGA